MSRSDATLIEHLHRRAPALAADWMRPPLVVLPVEGWASYLLEEATLATLRDDVPTLERLTWDDAVYDLGDLREAIADRISGDAGATLVAPRGRGRAWARVRTLERWREHWETSSPWVGPASADLLAEIAPRRWLVVEWWDEAAPKGLPRWPDLLMIDRDDPWSSAGRRYLYPGPLCRAERRACGVGLCHYDLCRRPADERIGCVASHGLMGTEAIAAAALLAYLTRTPMHPVEVGPTTPHPTHAERRELRDRPWRSSRLAHVILVDLEHAGDYGHPSARPGVGTHASPRPHQRRGHWRRLDGGARRVWVRPAWVGATVWEHEGRSYRVLGQERDQ